MSSKRPESFKNCTVKFKISVLTSKVCFPEPNSKNARVQSIMISEFNVDLKNSVKGIRPSKITFWQCKR